MTYVLSIWARSCTPAIDLPCACTTLRKATRALSRIYDDALAAVGMNVTQLAMAESRTRGHGHRHAGRHAAPPRGIQMFRPGDELRIECEVYRGAAVKVASRDVDDR
jgi:hypothetical protein